MSVTYIVIESIICFRIDKYENRLGDTPLPTWDSPATVINLGTVVCALLLFCSVEVAVARRGLYARMQII